MKENYKYSEITELIIKAFYNVYNKLGYGFLEKVYENGMMIELKRLGLKVEKQKPIKVFYDEFEIGEYFADLVVNDSVIVELKAAENLLPEHEAQLVNYLKATDIEVGMLLNFGKEPKFKRRVLTSEFKNHKKS
ncbi:MAG: GxxExxY protein [Ignavibacterium sp.]|jgi:GxxExxY protein|uniref:GxxExxY protein n=1 Tax=Ignavibacterium sp. TaxID=2651167 RepID=UPI00329A20EB